MDTADPPSPEPTLDEQDLELPQTPRKLPDDLPTSLNDRRNFPSYTIETEVYDAWQGTLSDIGGMSWHQSNSQYRILTVYHGTHTITTCF